MLQRIERQAQLSVARGCGFAVLAIVTFMVGMSGDLAASFKCGGLLMLIGTAVLALKAFNAPRRPYKSTELWIMLKHEERPDAAIAQQIISTVLREIYVEFARQAALIAAVLLAVSVLMRLAGMHGTFGAAP